MKVFIGFVIAIAVLVAGTIIGTGIRDIIKEKQLMANAIADQADLNKVVDAHLEKLADGSLMEPNQPYAIWVTETANILVKDDKLIPQPRHQKVDFPGESFLLCGDIIVVHRILGDYSGVNWSLESCRECGMMVETSGDSNQGFTVREAYSRVGQKFSEINPSRAKIQ